MKIKLAPSSFRYRQIKEEFPDIKEVWSVYYPGDYYDVSKTDFYDEEGNLIKTISHGTYG